MLASKSHATLKAPCYSQSPMLLSKPHATLKAPCYYEQIFGGARFARRSLGPGRHLGHIWETPGRHLISSERHLGHLGDILETSGRHLRDIWDTWETSGRHLPWNPGVDQFLLEKPVVFINISINLLTLRGVFEGRCHDCM